jgi:magnesium transporter
MSRYRLVISPAGFYYRHRFRCSFCKGGKMPYISQIIGRTVVDSEGEKIGRVDEVLATQKPGIQHPVLVALAVSKKKEIIYYPFSEIAVLFAQVIPLSHKEEVLPHYQVKGDEIQVIQDVLDKQIIDTNGIRVVRVNDLELARVGT